MQYFHQDSILRQFLRNQDGGTPTRLALMFAVVTVLGTVLFVPLIDNAAQRIARNGLGIDYSTTASTGQVQNKYIIRKSILNQEGSVICLQGTHAKCEESEN